MSGIGEQPDAVETCFFLATTRLKATELFEGCKMSPAIVTRSSYRAEDTNMRMIWSLAVLLLLLGVAQAQKRYFGFYDCDDQCMDETHTYANVAMIRVHRSDPAADVEAIQHAKSRGMKVIPMMLPMYLQEPYKKNPTYDNEWAAWVKAIKPYASEIVAIYPFDEPYASAWKERSSDKLPLFWTRMSSRQKQDIMEDQKARLELAKQRIRNAFPGVPLIYVEGFAAVDESLSLPDYEWIGFDCYAGWENCHGKSMPEYFSILKSKLRPAQKLVMVPPGFLYIKQNTTPNKSTLDTLSKLVLQFRDYFLKEPRFAAALVWDYRVFPPHEDGMQNRGVSGLPPDTRKVYQQFGESVVH
jgi:hypothetical protein